jgi:hypothetical protein
VSAGAVSTPGWRVVRCALAVIVFALAPLASKPISAQEVDGFTPGERGAMINWASDVATQEVTSSGREPVEASRVVLDVRDGAVVVQWSLSYDVVAQVRGGTGRHFPLVQVQVMAALERGGVEIARWPLGEDRVRGGKDGLVRVQVTGTASGLFVDRKPGSGRKTYVLRVWNARPAQSGAVTVSTRTMICEER